MNLFEIADRKIGPDEPTFIIAEMSANHNHNYDEAVKIIKAAKECGADAIKLQTYTADTLTLNVDSDIFRINGTIWNGAHLYELYQQAYTPWEWQPKLKKIADEIGIILFSTPFDRTAVDFLEEMDVPAHKVASFELVDIPLIEYIASKKKPIIMSTGMADLAEISAAVSAVRGAGLTDLALLKCTSSYPAPAENMNLRTIPHLAAAFGVVTGLSDHTLGISVPVAAVATGACIIEKHFTLSRSTPGPDTAFSLEPAEFKEMVAAIRSAEKALGQVCYQVTAAEIASRRFRRSLFVSQDMAKGEAFSSENIRSIRPSNGLAPKYLKAILGKQATENLKKGTPLDWSHLE